MQMRSFTRFASFHAQGLIMSVPMFIISAIDAIIQPNLKWIVVALSAIVATLYLSFAVIGKPVFILPIIILGRAITSLRLMAAAIGLLASGVALDKIVGGLQAPAVTVMFLVPLVLLVIAFIKAMVEET